MIRFLNYIEQSSQVNYGKLEGFVVYNKVLIKKLQATRNHKI